MVIRMWRYWALGVVAALTLGRPSAGSGLQAGPPPAQPPAASAPAKAVVSPSVDPRPREDAWWQERMQKMNARVKEGDVDLLFIGDSITQGWETTGKAVWEKYFAKRKAVNLGISGDWTQHVLWRLDHGNVEGISPKAAVVMIGTNNCNAQGCPADEIAAGIQAVVAKLREKLPKTKVLLLAVFPRGEKPNELRDKLAAASAAASACADGKMVHFLDIGAQFVEADGSISKEIMPDFLHLTETGYERWAKAIEPKLSELLGDKPAGK